MSTPTEDKPKDEGKASEAAAAEDKVEKKDKEKATKDGDKESEDVSGDGGRPFLLPPGAM